MSSMRRPAAELDHRGACDSLAPAARPVRSFRIFPLPGALLCAVALLAASATEIGAQEPDTAAAEG